jgi:cytoskeletal protein RodZ
MHYTYKRHHPSRSLIVLSVTSIIITVAILGSLSSVVQAVSYHDRFTQPTVQRENKPSSHSTTPASNTTTKITPTQSATTTSTPPSTAPAATTSTLTQTTQPATKAPVVTSQPIVKTVTPPDTAAAAQTTTTAQANVDSLMIPVTYTSHQISEDLRDRLIMLAVVLGMSGLALYVITFIRPKPEPRSIPVSYSVPVQFM